MLSQTIKSTLTGTSRQITHHVTGWLNDTFAISTSPSSTPGYDDLDVPTYMRRKLPIKGVTAGEAK